MQGYAVMLQEFVKRFHFWCGKVGLPIEDKLARDITEACKRGVDADKVILQLLMMDLLRGIGTPVIMLIGEML